MEALLALIRGAPGWAFSLFVTGGVVVLSHRYGVWPSDIIPRNYLWIFTAMFLIGGSLTVYSSWTPGWRMFREWRYRRSVAKKQLRALTNPMANAILLTHFELASIGWLIANNYSWVEAEIYDEPFAGLIRKGFLIAHDGSTRHQKLQVNPAAVDELRKIISDGARTPRGLEKDLEHPNAPWQRRV